MNTILVPKSLDAQNRLESDIRLLKDEIFCKSNIEFFSISDKELQILDDHGVITVIERNSGISIHPTECEIITSVLDIEIILNELKFKKAKSFAFFERVFNKKNILLYEKAIDVLISVFDTAYKHQTSVHIFVIEFWED